MLRLIHRTRMASWDVALRSSSWRTSEARSSIEHNVRRLQISVIPVVLFQMQNIRASACEGIEASKGRQAHQSFPGYGWRIKNNNSGINADTHDKQLVPLLSQASW